VSSRLNSEVSAAPVVNLVHGGRSEDLESCHGSVNRCKQRPERDCLIKAEISLMTRSNSLLSHKKFPVRRRREFPSTVLKLLPYLAQTLTRRGPDPTKFPVFSQLAGNFWLRDPDVLTRRHGRRMSEERRRRHQHHEHHASVSHGTHARDRGPTTPIKNGGVSW
jgi:hypothetical protein